MMRGRRRSRGRSGGRRPVQWLANLNYNNNANLVNATVSTVLLYAGQANLAGNPGSLPILDFTLFRLVGDILPSQQAQSSGSLYSFHWGIYITKIDSGSGKANFDPTLAEDADAGWLMLKHMQLSNDGTAPNYLAPKEAGWQSHDGEGPLHVDIRSKRIIGADDAIVLATRADQVSGTAQAIRYTNYIRMLVAKVA